MVLSISIKWKYIDNCTTKHANQTVYVFLFTTTDIIIIFVFSHLGRPTLEAK